jgi:hypothetical protein
MPVFVEWEWKEQAKSFLVIFHFYDDFSKTNLRIAKHQDKYLKLMIKPSGVLKAENTWMTWAPSHPELALLTELLSYANIVNGLSDSVKRKLGRKLLGESYDQELNAEYYEATHIATAYATKILFYTEIEADGFGHPHLCVELCQEYIDDLKSLLKPYLR